jgi:uncharacterized protein RhaS with RHS repeats
MHYNYFRDYDPSTGRYIESDPIGLLGGLNTYSYVGGNPVLYGDSRGLFIDTVADAGFILYDLYRIAKDNVFGNCDNLQENLIALGADAASVFVPGATGLGSATRAAAAAKGSKRFSDEKQALVDMAKQDKRTGISAEDMQAYKDLNRDLPDPFPSNKVRGPEVHPGRPHGSEPHGHVGPVNHIPIKE